jgi:hypothetical protein
MQASSTEELLVASVRIGTVSTIKATPTNPAIKLRFIHSVVIRVSFLRQCLIGES